MYKHFKEAAGNILSWEKPDIKLYTNFKTEITLQRFWNHEIEKEIYNLQLLFILINVTQKFCY